MRAVIGWMLALSLAAESRRHRISKKDPLSFENLVIPDDRLSSVFLHGGRTHKIFYLLQHDVDCLLITVTPCSAPVAWVVEFRNSSETGKVDPEAGGVGPATERRPRDYTARSARSGLYTVVLTAGGDGWVQLYATTLGPPTLLRPSAKMAATPRRVKGTVLLKWPPSLVDPELMDYVVVWKAGSREGVGSLCRATGELRNPPVPGRYTPLQLEAMGNRTSLTLRELKPATKYHVEVFVVNRRTNMSYVYAEEDVEYRRPRPVPLRNGRTVTVNLRRTDGRAVFRFKVKWEAAVLEVGVTACGPGARLDVELLQRGRSEPLLAQSVVGYSLLSLPRPLLAKVYVLRLSAPHTTSSVQVVASLSGLTDPRLPRLLTVHEYRGLRACRSVRLGWLPAPGPATYCVTATEVKKATPFSPLPDQCTVEAALNSLDYSVFQCTEIQPDNMTVIVEEVTNLKPGRFYDIQVSVKKQKSKTLSYELVRVRTKPTCNR